MIKHRETREVIVGGVLVVVAGRTVALKPEQAAQFAAVLTPAASDHPWPDEIHLLPVGRARLEEAAHKVDPTVVAEVTADAATQAGQARHGMRYVPLRPDLRPDDLPRIAGEVGAG